jgi:hypothetical protein
MGSFRNLLLQGEALRQEDQAAECREIEIQEAIATYGAGRQAEREARIATRWDRILAAVAPEGAEKADDGDDDEKKEPPVRHGRPPPRRRRRPRPAQWRSDSAAFAQTDTEEGWDEAMEAVASDARGATPLPAETAADAGWDGALREVAAPTGSSSPHMFGRARHALAGLWRSMFST